MSNPMLFILPLFNHSQIMNINIKVQIYKLDYLCRNYMNGILSISKSLDLFFLYVHLEGVLQKY